MGNNKFRLSNMIPNAWFRKLKDTSKTKHHVNNNTDLSERKPEPEQPHHFSPRKSYYITRDLVPIDGLHVPKDPPRKSSKKRHSPRKKIIRSPLEVVTSSVSAGCRFHETIRGKPDSPPLEYSASSSSFSFSDEDSSSPPEFKSELGLELELELPPIITKPAKFNDMVNDIKKKKERTAPKENNNGKNSGPVRKFGANSPGMRLRVNSPKIRNRKIQGLARKSVSSTSSSSNLSESFAVVKSSFDPQKDFRESMVEMILENNIRASKDLEDLLACYLSLNSDEYHDLIIKVFKQIWFDLNDVQFKS